MVLGAQAIAALHVIARLLRTGRGARIATVTMPQPGERVSVLLPVLNEGARVGPCLERLAALGDEVREIVVIDGGSSDGTLSLIERFSGQDARIRLVDASPVPLDWNGKAWGLERGFEHIDAASDWVLTVDADVRVGPSLVRSLLAHANTSGTDALSVATPQRVSGAAEAVVHPALLTTLVYRYGIPGMTTIDAEAVQANGQCFLARTRLLQEIGGFREGKDALSEDVSIARALARQGHPVGFHEPEDGESLIRVEMYATWREAWENWTRSLPMRDRRSGPGWWLRMADLTLVCGAPLPILAALVRRDDGGGAGRALRQLNVGLVVMRWGTAFGMRRAYRDVPATYLLSPLVDPLVVLKMWQMALKRRHTWRGRPMERR